MEDLELRCPVKLLGRITQEGLIELKCNSNRCGAGRGVVVLHRWDPTTGLLKETEKYRDPGSLFNKERI